MPYKNREDRLAHNRKYYKEHYVPKGRPGPRTDKEYIVKHGERRSKEGWEKQRERNKVWHVKNRDRRLAQQKARYAKSPEQAKDHYLRHEFGISLDDYLQMLASQNGVCAICHKPETAVFKGKVKALAVDHCHASGQVRSLLCSGCNLTLGYVQDDQAVLLSMIDYLKRHQNG